jgi:RNA polymerase sigma-70 factor (ECF subfamily)
MTPETSPGTEMHEYENEERLVSALKAGDDAAYEYLVRTHAGQLLAVARRYLSNDEDARDALQDAFLSAFKAIGRFEGQSRISTWLHRIVINSALMKLRQGKGREEESIDDLLPKFTEDGTRYLQRPGTWAEPADAAVQRREIRALVRKYIQELPETYRTVLLLRDIEDLDTEETARFLEISPNAVKIRLHRARLALRALLHPHLKEEAA